MRPLIIPIFISHAGCPHRCIFCDQKKITDQDGYSIGPQEVRRSLDRALEEKAVAAHENRELAFYGGTFTGLPKSRMKSLLEAALPYVKSGLVHAIRISTRPDSLDAERLALLKAHHVATVELGVQSMDDRVLALSKRGHTSEDTQNAVYMLKDHGFKAGIQLMPGLPGDSEEGFLSTTKKILKLAPQMVRIYPALAIKGTQMARMYEEGLYQPFSLKKAVHVCAESVRLFETNGIPVIRIGLMGSSSLTRNDHILSGPWHPAFGFLVRSHIHFRNIVLDLPPPDQTKGIRIYSPKREIPLVRGYKNSGIREIERIIGARVMGVLPDDKVPQGRIRWEVV